jgi:putative membrane protein
VSPTFDETAAFYLPLSIPITTAAAFLFIHLVDRVKTDSVEIPPTKALKAILANWIEDLNSPIETLFEKFGSDKNVNFSLLALKSRERLESIVVVSSFHPGPFKNVGSSQLPYLIKEALEKKLRCVAAVPHGLFGHETDLSSQRQNQRVLDAILGSARFSNFTSKATPFMRSTKEAATASCQVFGRVAVFTLTLAPETTEDFPKEVGDFILEESSNQGLDHVVIINAHNSINAPFNVSMAVGALKEATLEALQKACSVEQSPFKGGAAKIVPKEFGLRDGMGLGGLSVLLIETAEHVCAYVTIDGNNMISGLRERILESLKDLGIEAGEILTTDTHAVNALVLNARGYRPIGEVIPAEKLIDYIKTAAKEALRNMKPASLAWRAGEVADVRVIGERQIKGMSLLADRALRRAKRIFVPLFSFVWLLLASLIIVL